MNSEWNYTQAERDEVRDGVACPTCEAPAGEPCVGFSRFVGTPFEYQQYVHLARLRTESCPVCGQPDNCGDCNHQPAVEVAS